MLPFGDHNSSDFHFAAPSEPPPLHGMLITRFNSRVPVRSTNLPAQTIKAATAFSSNPVPHVNTLNPGPQYYRQ